ncbi:ECF-type sigma factor [Frateuria sp. STR12]|uniref:ECF-type sigma factor n=1 Tax=Frateuria hangzhouensis TaxID=2995589 RepID=UPI0022608374|nr:ECF-type sigma factor [Frateuria sp. STR12]MCX7513911.1 ECF-type sigma factor [Frateuria sp. STR12]
MRQDTTELVQAIGRGEVVALDLLFARVYGELKRVARRQLHSAHSPTVDTTGLVHDAYLKLASPQGLDLHSRKHFFALAAKAMRQIVVDHARAHAAGKRGGGVAAVALDAAAEVAAGDMAPDQLLQLDRALTELESQQPRLVALIEMRFFAGLELADIAAMQEVSERTLNRDWRRARAELYAALYP